MKTAILNIAGGKINPLDLDNVGEYFIVNVDKMYYSRSNPAEIETRYSEWFNGDIFRFQGINHSADVFEFMERITIPFDLLTCYRFLEHVKRTDVLFFIYLMSTCLRIGGQVDVIVPNYRLLAQLIIEEQVHEDMEAQAWEAHDILVTSEIVNEPDSPHASIWTPTRLAYFFTLEGRFKVLQTIPQFKFDGRDIYTRFRAERIA